MTDDVRDILLDVIGYVGFLATEVKSIGGDSGWIKERLDRLAIDLVDDVR